MPPIQKPTQRLLTDEEIEEFLRQNLDPADFAEHGFPERGFPERGVPTPTPGLDRLPPAHAGVVPIAAADPPTVPPSPPPLPPDYLLPQPAPGRVIHNTDLASHARWAEFDRKLAAGELRIEDQLPPEAEGVNGTTPERAMVERYCRRYPHTAYHNGAYYRFETGRWVPLPLDRFLHEINAIVDHARVTAHLPPGPVHRLPRLIAERVRVKLATVPLNPPAPGLLPLANGLFDPASARLQPYTETDFVPHPLPHAYDPAATAPVWQAFLQSRLPAAEEFLQEFAGLALTAEPRYEVALWLHGHPGTGKSTFLHALQVLLGHRAGALNPAALLSGRFSPRLVEGKTLLVCAEPSRLNLADPARLNTFISGEPYTAQPKYGTTEIFRPQAKLIWAFTRLPFVPDPESPLFRRLFIVPFPALSPSDQDASLKSRLAAEGPGLLNWALAGLQRLTARGRFAPPPAILEATEQFRQSNDLPGLFLAERCQPDPEKKIQGSRLHQTYTLWCRANGHFAPSSTLLARDWERLGLQRRRIDGRSYWAGYRLKPG